MPARSPYLSDYWTTDDFLHFSDFCPALRDILMEAQTPLTVGVFGAWGSGKTSLLRMLKKEIDDKGLRYVRTVWFTAWKYDRQEALWRAFILRVLEALYPRLPREKWGEAEKELAAHLDRMVESVYRAVEWEESARWALDLSRLGKEAAKLPGFLLLSSAGTGKVAEALGIAPDLAEVIRREAQAARLEQLVSMEQFEDRFRQALKMALKLEEGVPEDRRRLVVFVDDLDRCLPEKAVEVLEAIKLFLEVEGTVFVLGMDREVIERGIEVRYGSLFRRAEKEGEERAEMPIRGDAYLQKIVQIPFHLPPLGVEDLEEYIQKLEAGLPPPARLGEVTRRVFAHGLFPNPRQVKRALNIFRLLKAIAQERKMEVAWPLLAKTVLIQTQWPDLYRLWRQYPTLVRTLEKEYVRLRWTEEEVVLGRPVPPEGEPTGEERPPQRRGLLEPYLTERTRYGLLYRLLTFPEEPGEGEQRARFEGLDRSQMEVYVRLAGAVEPEQPAVEVPGDLLTALLSGDRAKIQDAVAWLEEQEKDREGELHREARRQLLAAMRDPNRPAHRRVGAGDGLALLGDPRFRADAWYLPDEPLLGFVEVPERPFLMGSDPERDPMAYEEETPQHEVTLPTYYIGRYPVTVAQFRAFAEASGYEPGAPDSLRGVDNHPVVGVTWYEALAYCRWLTEVLREEARKRGSGGSEAERRFWEGLARGELVVTLPSEAEWEKAARGGLAVPAGENPNPTRRYPWRDGPDPNRANYIDTGIGGTSAVGCFPGGASPYGVEDLSGNVWEWTRSLYRKYPYDPEDGREDLEAGGARALRGGSFDDEAGLVRCAFRYGYAPNFRGRYYGFRVVASPVSHL